LLENILFVTVKIFRQIFLTRIPRFYMLCFQFTSIEADVSNS